MVIESGSWGRDERDVLRQGARALGACARRHPELRFLDGSGTYFESVRWSNGSGRPLTRADIEVYKEVLAARRSGARSSTIRRSSDRPSRRSAVPCSASKCRDDGMGPSRGARASQDTDISTFGTARVGSG